MSVKDFILQRKIGAFELLMGLILLELFLGSRLILIFIVLLAIAFYFAKRHFGGEFSIAQLQGLFVHKKDQEKTTNG